MNSENAEFMTTKEDVLQFLEERQWTPITVAKSPRATLASRRRIQTDRMRLNKLPVRSIGLYIERGAVKRKDANRQFKREGFISYHELIRVMRRLFPDIF